MDRKQILPDVVDSAIEIVKRKIHVKLKEKGPHAMASIHEILGIVTEEYDELIAAVRSDSHEAVMSECEDVAVAAIFGLMSHQVGGLDW
jgi:NTP pyrophosphatase (non-canonical NTP hydrolase)